MLPAQHMKITPHRIPQNAKIASYDLLPRLVKTLRAGACGCGICGICGKDPRKGPCEDARPLSGTTIRRISIAFSKHTQTPAVAAPFMLSPPDARHAKTSDYWTHRSPVSQSHALASHAPLAFWYRYLKVPITQMTWAPCHHGALVDELSCPSVVANSNPARSRKNYTPECHAVDPIHDLPPSPANQPAVLHKLFDADA
ncbi:hypothetical protein OAN307_c18540 [Octadecabacter antarcticus 307]|uniref:Uncharacterized protein n=1 Tax=Octadecabacter antarcticus 307 TaxID=391626 RepID=M9R6X8_9RHOB|nr:hypothetical protein OAN307_c18540 [Octadecabacter antarcticus 307]